jgi:hypothetical protein
MGSLTLVEGVTMRKSIGRLRVIIAFIIIILFTAVNGFKFWQSLPKSIKLDGLGRDSIVEWDERLDPLKKDLPERGIVGYVSEKDIPGLTYSDTDEESEYIMTQYILAPLIIVRRVNTDLVIGNFGSIDYQEEYTRKLGLVMIKNYGMGIYLFKGNPK